MRRRLEKRLCLPETQTEALRDFLKSHGSCGAQSTTAAEPCDPRSSASSAGDGILTRLLDCLAEYLLHDQVCGFTWAFSFESEAGLLGFVWRCRAKLGVSAVLPVTFVGQHLLIWPPLLSWVDQLPWERLARLAELHFGSPNLVNEYQKLGWIGFSSLFCVDVRGGRKSLAFTKVTRTVLRRWASDGRLWPCLYPCGGPEVFVFCQGVLENAMVQSEARRRGWTRWRSEKLSFSEFGKSLEGTFM